MSAKWKRKTIKPRSINRRRDARTGLILLILGGIAGWALFILIAGLIIQQFYN